MALSAKSLAGPGYVILNILRFWNIISLLAVISASIVMVIKTVMVSQFYFFDGVSHIITTFISAFLIVSEANLFRQYFAAHWPLLSPAHGFVTLGLAMVTLGCNILGNLNKPATSQKSLGPHFWRLVLAAGILVITFGFFNIATSYIFRDSARGVTARQVRAKGAVAIPGGALPFSFLTQKEPSTTSSTIDTFSTTPTKPPKRASRRWPTLGRRSSTLPSYHTSPVPSSRYSGRGSGESEREVGGLKISGPMEVQGVVGVVRPDSAFHPSRYV